MEDRAASGLSAGAREFLAGGAGGAAGVVVGQPLDVVRVRLQQPGGARGAGPGGTAGALAALVRREGPLAMFKGMSYPLATTSFQNSVVFWGFGAAMRALRGPGAEGRGPPGYAEVFAAGCASGTVQTFISSPVELLKLKLQLQTQNRGMAGYVGPLRMAERIYRARGLRGFAHGFSATLLRDAPSYGVYFVLYDAIREAVRPGCRAAGNDGLGNQLFAGGMAGALAWYVAYPADVIKNRYQASFDRYRDPWDCYRTSVAREGYGWLGKGLAATLIRAFIGNAAIFSVYELTMQALERRDAALA